MPATFASSRSIYESRNDISLIVAAHRVAAVVDAEAPALDDDGAYPERGVAALADELLLVAPFQRRAGKEAIIGPSRIDELVQVLAIIGAGSLPLGRLYEGHINAAILINAYGRQEQIDLMARRAADGHLMAVWNAEAADGVKLIERDGVKVLQGRKIFASGAGKVRYPLITARCSDASLVMILPDAVGRPGDLDGWKVQGMRASASGAMDFSGLEISAEHVLGISDDYHRQPLFSGGAWRFCAVQFGSIARLFDLACAQLNAMGRAADPYQIARIGSAAIAVETARLWVEKAALLSSRSETGSDANVAYVNLARGAVERAGLDVLELVHRSIGLGSFSRANPIERISRDLATYLRQPNPDKALTDGTKYILDQKRSILDVFR